MKNGPGSASSPVGLWDSWHMQSIEANEEQWRGSQEGLASKPACPLLTSSHVQRNITQDHTRLACHKASANSRVHCCEGLLWYHNVFIGYCPDFTENPTTFLILLLIKISPHNIFFTSPKLECTHTVCVCHWALTEAWATCSGLGSIFFAWASDWVSWACFSRSHFLQDRPDNATPPALLVSD